MAIGPTGNWTEWLLAKLAMDKVAVGPSGNGTIWDWTNWLIFETVGIYNRFLSN
jgi:hypothetical protein